MKLIYFGDLNDKSMGIYLEILKTKSPCGISMSTLIEKIFKKSLYKQNLRTKWSWGKFNRNVVSVIFLWSEFILLIYYYFVKKLIFKNIILMIQRISNFSVPKNHPGYLLKMFISKN